MNQNKDNDTTNWKAWYWGLVLFLVLQIAIYFFITMQYKI